jgi:hypothetical protein
MFFLPRKCKGQRLCKVFGILYETVFLLLKKTNRRILFSPVSFNFPDFKNREKSEQKHLMFPTLDFYHSVSPIIRLFSRRPFQVLSFIFLQLCSEVEGEVLPLNAECMKANFRYRGKIYCPCDNEVHRYNFLRFSPIFGDKIGAFLK